MRAKPSVTIPDHARNRAIAALRAYCADNLDGELGDLNAALMLDFILTGLGPTIYNQAIADAGAFLEERVRDPAG